MSNSHLATMATTSWLPAAYIVIAIAAGCVVALSGAYLILKVLDWIDALRERRARGVARRLSREWTRYIDEDHEREGWSSPPKWTRPF